MKLQQLRYLCEVVKNDLNLSKAAERLHASQPGVSKQIIQLEDELGIKVFVRSGKRFSALTPPGRQVFEIAQRITAEAQNLKALSTDFRDEKSGSLTIATTHTQARYALPPVVRRFRGKYPQVRLILHQGSPAQIADQILAGKADLGIATEALDQYTQLAVLPCYEWNRCVIAPPGHPVTLPHQLTLEELAAHPIITYDFAYTGRATMDRAFDSRGLTPDVVLTAIDADVIKTYVELGLGVGIIAHMAFDPERDTNLRAVDASHLFEPSVTRLGVRRGTFLRRFVYDFIEMFAPHLSKPTVEAAVMHQEAISA